MVWQDVVITIGNVTLALALLPTVLGERKPALLTSGLTSSMLGVQAIAIGSLGLWFAAGSLVVSSALWAVLLLQVRGRTR